MAVEIPRYMVVVFVVDQHMAKSSQGTQEREDLLGYFLFCEVLFVEEEMCFFLLLQGIWLNIQKLFQGWNSIR